MNKATKKRPDQMLITALKSFKTGHLNDTVAAGDTFYMSEQLALSLISQGQCKLAAKGAVPGTTAKSAAATATAQAEAAAAKVKAAADAKLAYDLAAEKAKVEAAADERAKTATAPAATEAK